MKKKTKTTIAKKTPSKSFRVDPIEQPIVEKIDKRQFSIRYRPSTIKDMIVGNPDILVEVEGHLDAQALLVLGETGTGKTTLGRAIAMAINGDTRDIIHEPATERGVDYIRKLQERIKFSPLRKKWVVILDECHSLTKDAMTALLTLIESPPHERVIFILCTNHAYALPKEAFNRCLKIEIEKPTAEQATPYLTKILLKELPESTKEDRKKLAIKAITDAQFCMREAMQNLESYVKKIRGKIAVAKVLGQALEGRAKDGQVKDNVEQAAGNILLALRDGFDDPKKGNSVIIYILTTFSQHDPHALMARIEGILYHGFILKHGGKWNWQGKPYAAVFGKNPPSTQLTARLLLEFGQIRIGMREAGDPAIYAASRLSHLMRKP